MLLDLAGFSLTSKEWPFTSGSARQHSPDMLLKVHRWPPTLMRRPEHLPTTKVELFIGGVNIGDLLMDRDYTEFACCYLIRDTKGVWDNVICERYAALESGTAFIRGQLWLSRHLPGLRTCILEFPGWGSDSVSDSLFGRKRGFCFENRF